MLPVLNTAVDVGGQLKTNLIISEEDAKKIEAVNQKNNVLKEACVVVVLSSKVGGLEGSL
jgi:hypothetical protein